MRTAHVASIVIAALSIAYGCNTASQSECRPNTSAGFGAAGPIPIGAGVGVSSGGDFLQPPSQPQAQDDEDNPCVEPFAPSGTGKIAKCVVTWASSSAECKKQNGGKDTCTTLFETSKKYEDIKAATSECDKGNGVGVAGAEVLGCLCSFTDEPTSPFATYYCNGDSVCETTDGPPKSGGCSYSNHAIDASSEQDAVDRVNIKCAKEFQKKVPGQGVRCKSSNLVCKAGKDAPN